MRILRLHFSNLNSLHGTFSIDFTHRQYESGGLFLITGPTGAGKSTILDAITLALYGRTPRLSSISVSGNEIMSRGTGTCSASVEFEAGGRCFRSTFSQRRARGRPGGRLRQPEMKLDDVTADNLVLTAKISETRARVVQITGMEYEHFTRAVMLAQGEFAKFLATPPDERGKLLEMLTGAGIYSDISRAAIEACRSGQSQVQLAADVLARSHVLSDEERSERQRRCGELAQESAELGRELSRLAAARAWRSRYDANEQAMAELERRALELTEERRRFDGDEQRLAAARRAASVSAEVRAHEEAAAGLEQARAAVHQAAGELASLQQAQAESVQDLDRLRRQLHDFQEQERGLGRLLPEVRGLDARIAALETACAEARDRCRQCDERLAQAGEGLEHLRQKARELADGQERVMREYHQCEEAGAWLSAELAALRLRFGRLGELRAQIREACGELGSRQAGLREALQARAALESRVLEAQQRLQHLEMRTGQVRGELEGLLEGQTTAYYELAVQHAQQALRLAEAEKQLADRRLELQEGEPCPLCGSRDHPYALREPPPHDALECRLRELQDRLRRLGGLEAEVSRLELEGSHGRTSLDLAGSELAAHDRETARLRQEQERLEAQLAQWQSSCAEHETTLRNDLTAHALISGDMPLSEGLLADLSARQDRFGALRAARDELEQQLAALRDEQTALTVRHEACAAAAAEAGRERECAEAALRQAQGRRQELFAGRVADAEEQEARSRVQRARDDLSAAEARERELAAMAAAAASRAGELTEQLQSRQQDETRTGEVLDQALCAQGFDSPGAWRAALLPAEECERLQAEGERLRGMGERLQGQRQACLEARERLQAEAAAAPEAAVLEQTFRELTARQSECDRQWGGLRQELANDDRVRSELASGKEELRQRQAALGRYARLRDLMGPSEGKVLRNYVQSLTFRHMIDGANVQLQAMTDRYVLMPRPEAPLELDVVDAYEANAVRPADNLSGGESFIVSLALALSLSRMSSGRAQVETMFLDEGFGALDEISLGIVLNALNSLQRRHRLIGVISHVGALQERIPTQIAVEKVRDGRSTLRGPGVQAASGTPGA